MKYIAIHQLPYDNDNIYSYWDNVSDIFDFNEYRKVWQNSSYNLHLTDNDKDIVNDIYSRFNVQCPLDFNGHSLSVSDIIQVEDRYYYCDEYDWKDISKHVRKNHLT